MRRQTLALPVVLLAGAALVVTATSSAGQTSEAPPTIVSDHVAQATPQIDRCAPGSRPEPGLQGRVPADEVAAGRAADGYSCNLTVIGRHGPSGGYKVERYVDAAGHECACYDTTLLFPSNAENLSEGPTGVAVLDMSDPSNPRQTATLVTPAMQTPHESLLVNARRGLLAAVAGNPIFAPGRAAHLYTGRHDTHAITLSDDGNRAYLAAGAGFARPR